METNKCETCGDVIRAGRRFCAEDASRKDGIIDYMNSITVELKNTPVKKKQCSECPTLFSGLGAQCSAPCYESFTRKQKAARDKIAPKAPKRGTQQVKKKSKPSKAVVVTCPTPMKKAFSTYAEGAAFIEEKHAGQRMRTYACQCGALHIGHNNKVVDSPERIKELDNLRAAATETAPKKPDFSRFPPNMR